MFTDYSERVCVGIGDVVFDLEGDERRSDDDSGEIVCDEICSFDGASEFGVD